MNPLQTFLNLLAVVALAIFLGYLALKSNGCSAFNPDVSCSRSMRGEL